MNSPTGYPRHILDEYRRRIEDDLKLLDIERTWIDNSLPATSDTGSRVAAIRQIREVLTSVHKLLEDARTSTSQGPAPRSSSGDRKATPTRRVPAPVTTPA